MANDRHTKSTDAKLVSQAMKGNADAIEELCRLHAQSILYTAIKLMGNRQDGEDLSQEVCVRMVRDITKLKKAKSFNSWLYTIIKGEYNRQVRKLIKERENSMGELSATIREPAPMLDPEWYLENAESRQAFSAMLEGLPVNYKLCVIMFYFENMSHKEIAEVMGVNAEKVNNMLRRARQIMRVTLESDPSFRELVSHFSAIVSVPVLGAFMRQEAIALPQAPVNAAIQDALAANAPAGAAAAGGAVAVTVVKGAVAVAAAMAVSAAGYGLAHSAGEVHSQLGETTASLTPAQSAPTQQQPSSVVLEMPINTLEDMIGTTCAQQLLAMVGGGPVSSDAFQQLLADTGLAFEQDFQEGDTQPNYALYVLDKQDKRLMVLAQSTQESNIAGLVYRFTTVGELPPVEGELLYRYQEWGG